MAKITINQVVALIEEKKAKVARLRKERKDSAVIQFEQGDEELVSRPEREVSDITKEIELLSSQIRELHKVLAKVNFETQLTTEHKGEKVSLGEAVILLRQLREEVRDLENIASKKSRKDPSKERQVVDGGVAFVKVVRVTETLFDAAEVKAQIEEAQLAIEQIQAEVNSLNVITTVEFDNVAYEG